MAERILKLSELKGRMADDLLRDAAGHRKPVSVVLEDGSIVVIQLATQLKPLPELAGFVPQNWKDAIYGE